MATLRAELLAAGALLGLLTKTPAAWEQGGDIEDKVRVDALVQARLDARAAKDWAEADRIREELRAEGIEIMDSAGGSTWRRL
jgi:cysteinyl-tRNA synthetase